MSAVISQRCGILLECSAPRLTADWRLAHHDPLSSLGATGVSLLKRCGILVAHACSPEMRPRGYRAGASLCGLSSLSGATLDRLALADGAEHRAIFAILQSALKASASTAPRSHHDESDPALKRNLREPGASAAAMLSYPIAQWAPCEAKIVLACVLVADALLEVQQIAVAHSLASAFPAIWHQIAGCIANFDPASNGDRAIRSHLLNHLGLSDCGRLNALVKLHSRRELLPLAILLALGLDGVCSSWHAVSPQSLVKDGVEPREQLLMVCNLPAVQPPFGDDGGCRSSNDELHLCGLFLGLLCQSAPHAVVVQRAHQIDDRIGFDRPIVAIAHIGRALGRHNDLALAVKALGPLKPALCFGNRQASALDACSQIAIHLGCPLRLWLFKVSGAREQFKHQLIKCDLGLVVVACKAHKLAIEVHGVVVCLSVVHNLFTVHARPPLRADVYVHVEYTLRRRRSQEAIIAAGERDYNGSEYRGRAIDLATAPAIDRAIRDAKHTAQALITGDVVALSEAIEQRVDLLGGERVEGNRYKRIVGGWIGDSSHAGHMSASLSARYMPVSILRGRRKIKHNYTCLCIHL